MIQIEQRPIEPNERTTLERIRPGGMGRTLGPLLWGRRYAAVEFLDADLAAGKVESISCTVDAYAKGVEARNEGPKLFLDTGAGVVVLFGQWLFDPHVVLTEMPDDAADDAWFAEFDFVRAPRSGVVLSLSARSSKTIQPSSAVAATDIPFLLPSMLLAGRLTDVPARLSEFDASLQRTTSPRTPYR